MKYSELIQKCTQGKWSQVDCGASLSIEGPQGEYIGITHCGEAVDKANAALIAHEHNLFPGLLQLGKAFLEHIQLDPNLDVLERVVGKLIAEAEEVAK